MLEWIPLVKKDNVTSEIIEKNDLCFVQIPPDTLIKVYNEINTIRCVVYKLKKSDYVITTDQREFLTIKLAIEWITKYV